jgi:23S rRNA (guanosine2251-2'-O)-methyltransferase
MKKPVEISETMLLLPDIRSVHNVGSIFRTADCAGVGRIFLAGTTPAPLDRFGRKRKDFAKVALGAEDTVPWESANDPLALIKVLKKRGVQIVALEQSTKAVDYKALIPKKPMLLVLGNEVEGVSRELLALADSIIEIPQRGKKESLNVSVAAGIALYRLLNI